MVLGKQIFFCYKGSPIKKKKTPNSLFCFHFENIYTPITLFGRLGTGHCPYLINVRIWEPSHLQLKFCIDIHLANII